MRWSTVVLLTAAVTLGARAQTPSAVDLARQLQARYTTIRDFTADFTSVSEDGLLHKKATQRGNVRVKKPGRMRWIYTAPDKNQLWADGAKLYWYEPAARQVYVSDLPKANEPSTAFNFLAGLGDLVRDFTPSLPSVQHEGEWRLALVPKVAQADFASLTLVVDAKSFALKGYTTVDQQGATLTMTFANMRENVGLPDSDFSFTPPKGVDVIKR
jgi:outer membrane lipoprotein carrier protein